jgi:serine protease Do
MSLYEHGFEGNSDQDSRNSQSGCYTGENNSMYGSQDSNGTYSYQKIPDADQNNNDKKPKKRKEKKDRSGFGYKVGRGAVIAAVFGIVAGATFTGTTYVGRKVTGQDKKDIELTTSSNKVKTTSTKSGSGSSSTTAAADVSSVAASVMPAIVQVTNMSVTEYRSFFGSYEKPTESRGSGIIIAQDSNYVYIATNNHVISDSQKLTVTFVDDSAVSAELVGSDEQSDLAVLKVKISDIGSTTLNKISVATLGDSDSVKVGQEAIVIGNALGYGQSVTTGVISAVNREVTLTSDTSGNTYTNKLIQTDAAVNPGNSGGALLNNNGEVIGVVSAKYSDTSVEGMGYAIPITSASSIIKQLMNGETVDHSADSSKDASTAYLGIYGFDVNEEYSKAYDMPNGVYVSEAVKDQAAYNAGITKGDIITSVDGTSVSSMSELKQAIAAKKPGDKIKLVVAKRSEGYKTKTVEVTLGDSKNASDSSSNNGSKGNDGSGNSGSGSDSENGKSIEDYIKEFFNGGN